MNDYETTLDLYNNFEKHFAKADLTEEEKKTLFSALRNHIDVCKVIEHPNSFITSMGSGVYTIAGANFKDTLRKQAVEGVFIDLYQRKIDVSDEAIDAIEEINHIEKGKCRKWIEYVRTGKRLR